MSWDNLMKGISYAIWLVLVKGTQLVLTLVCDWEVTRNSTPQPLVFKVIAMNTHVQ